MEFAPGDQWEVIILDLIQDWEFFFFFFKHNSKTEMKFKSVFDPQKKLYSIFFTLFNSVQKYVITSLVMLCVCSTECMGQYIFVSVLYFDILVFCWFLFLLFVQNAH